MENYVNDIENEFIFVEMPINYEFRQNKYSSKTSNSWSNYFRKTYNIITIFVITAVIYIYFSYKSDNTKSKF